MSIAAAGLAHPPEIHEKHLEEAKENGRFINLPFVCLLVLLG
jgi:hypothetical protein